MCPCITEPKFRFCVDETETSFVEILSALRARRKNAKQEMSPQRSCDCNFCVNEEQKKEAAPQGIFIDYMHEWLYL